MTSVRYYERRRSLYSKIERKLLQMPAITMQYHDFLTEYNAIGTWKSCVLERLRFSPVYIPHHFMLRESSTSTKFRVVFNTSCKTNDKTSLNDHLMVGPKLQQDILVIILR